MKKLIGLIAALGLVLALALTGVSCAATSAGTPTTTTPGTTTPPGSTLTLEEAQLIAENFIMNSSTFKFDGLEGTTKLVNSEEYGPISSFRSMVFIFEYETRHPGHGDRSGEILPQVITNHTAIIYVDIDKKIVRIAICDETWDMIKDAELPPPTTTVSGIVISGGDTTPPNGPQDAPRVFTYKIQKNDGSYIFVSYTAYPPSPAGDAARAKIALDFYSGTVEPGDFMEAQGSLDKEGNTVTVVNEGDYIKTSMPKIEITGTLIGGGDTTPEGLYDAPRTFVFEVEKNDGTKVNVSYTAYPPSPVGDANREKIGLSFYDDAGIKAGDYLRAFGTYDPKTHTLLVADEGDFIKTYAEKP